MIIQSVDNKKPEAAVGDPFIVAEGGSVVFPPNAITAVDIDTPSSHLIVVIDVPPLFGFITNTNAGKVFFPENIDHLYV